MTKYNKQFIVVKSQYVPHVLQYIAIRFWHIVTALPTGRWKYDFEQDKIACWFKTVMLIFTCVNLAHFKYPWHRLCIQAQSYTVQSYTQNHFMGNMSLTVKSKCIFIIRSVLFIIRSILLLLLFRSIYFTLG